MLLALDIGNSVIKAGVFGETLKVRKIAASAVKTASEYRKELEEALAGAGVDKAPSGVVISSVVPRLTEAVGGAAREIAGVEPVLAGPGRTGGLAFDIKEPGTLGPDRIASAVAASVLLGPALVVLDFGSATTVNFVVPGKEGAAGVFKGGAILPGIGMMLRALGDYAARLPRVELKEGSVPSAPGSDTEGDILAGVLCGTAGAVEKIIAKAGDKEGVRYRVAVTGGFMGHVLPWLERVDLSEPYLVLEGLKIIYMRETRDA
jgi:type III pantothenate kinase